MLGVRPTLGRVFADDDNSLASTPTAVLSHAYWQKTFGGDSGAIGRMMRLNGVDFTVVGVVPPSFFGAAPGRRQDFYVPACRVAQLMTSFSSDSPLTSDRFWWLQLVFRLKPGVTPDAVRARVGTEFGAMVAPRIKEPKQHARFSLRDGSRGFGFQQQDAVKPMVILAALVGLVLLIACANVANLLLARAAMRRREAAMRLALGAGRLRIVRQHLTESLILALASGAAGFLFSQWFASTVLSLTPERSALVLDLGFNWRVLGFAVALSVAAGVVVGLVPAIVAARASVATSLRAGTSVKVGWRRRIGFGRPLVALQIALSLLVLVVAGLLSRTLVNLQSVPLGVDPEGLVLFSLDATAAGYPDTQKAAATERLADRLRQLPGVRAVTWSAFPLLNNTSWMTHVRLADDAPQAPRKGESCFIMAAGRGFHETFGIPLVAGRLFDARDARMAPKVAVVNEAFVKKYVKSGPALGRSIWVAIGPDGQSSEIVGVVRDSKYQRIRQEFRPIVYLADTQQSLPLGPTFALKASDEAGGHLAADIERLVRELEPTLPVTRIRTFRDQVDSQLVMERSLSTLSTAFGLVALALAAIGLYGVLAFAVARRTAELGVRVALGASRGTVLRLVLVDSTKVVLPGALLGLIAALAATRLLASTLFGLKPNDPLTIGVATGLLLVVATAAAWIPARRAAAIDPVDALRCE